jgi:hypothetical protein
MATYVAVFPFSASGCLAAKPDRLSLGADTPEARISAADLEL